MVPVSCCLRRGQQVKVRIEHNSGCLQQSVSKAHMGGSQESLPHLDLAQQ